MNAPKEYYVLVVSREAGEGRVPYRVQILACTRTRNEAERMACVVATKGLIRSAAIYTMPNNRLPMRCWTWENPSVDADYWASAAGEWESGYALETPITAWLQKPNQPSTPGIDQWAAASSPMYIKFLASLGIDTTMRDFDVECAEGGPCEQQPDEPRE